MRTMLNIRWKHTEFFKELGVRYITFLPLVERLPDSETGVSAISVPSLAFGKFLCEIFDEWISKDIGNSKGPGL